MVDIPVITEAKYLRGTPEVCEDCRRFDVFLSSKPVPGYRYCQICLEGKLLDSNKKKRSDADKFFAQLELRAKPILKHAREFDFLSFNPQLPNGVVVQILQYDAMMASYFVRVENHGRVKDIILTDREIRFSGGDILRTPTVEYAINQVNMLPNLRR